MSIKNISKYRYVILFFLALAYFIQGMNVFVSGTLLPIIVEDLGITPFQSGILGAITQLMMGLLSIPFANFLYWPKYSLKWIISLSGFFSAISLIFQAFSPNFEILFITRLSYSVISVIPFAFWVAIRMVWFPRNEYGMVSSISVGSNSLGMFFALIAIPSLLVFFNNWKPIMILFGLVLLVHSFFWLFLGKEPQKINYLNNKKNKNTNEKKETPFKRALKHKEIVLTAISFSGVGIIWSALLTFYPTFLLKNHNIPLEIGGTISSILPIGALISSLIAGSLSDKLGRRKPFIWPCGIILPILYYLMLQNSNPTILYILSFASGFFAMLFPPICLTIPTDIPNISAAESAAGVSIIMTTATLLGIMGPFLAGYIYETIGSLGSALIPMSFTPVTLLIAIFIPETAPKKRIEVEKL